MPEPRDLDEVLRAISIDDSIFELRPDYRAVVIVTDGLEPGPSDALSEDLLSGAERSARTLLSHTPIEQIPQVAAWRDTYRSFGAKPQRTRNSLEALLRRVDDGLPRVNRLTDIYNAISVKHLLPLGGEDLSGYVGPPRLLRATGIELFEVLSRGEPNLEYPEVGEAVWADDDGVTCRRWNWRQSRRTQLTDATRQAVFILDALAPVGDFALLAASRELRTRLLTLGSDVRVAQRWIAKDGTFSRGDE